MKITKSILLKLIEENLKEFDRGDGAWVAAGDSSGAGADGAALGAATGEDDDPFGAMNAKLDMVPPGDTKDLLVMVVDALISLERGEGMFGR